MNTALSPCQTPFSGKSPPRKPHNAEVRPREYLTPEEVQRLMQAARRCGRHGHRDATLILIIYRHGLRVSEAVSLRWELVDLHTGRLHVVRRKAGTPSVHPLRGQELRSLRRLARENSGSPYLFVSERRSPLGDSAVRKLIARAVEWQDSPSPYIRTCCVTPPATSWPTMVTTCAIQHYLGHKNIQHTVRYTQLSAASFRDFWNE